MSLRQHEIAEANQRILNRFTDEKLMKLGTICRLQPGQRVLDLACGKGELLCRWAHQFGIHGLGIDINTIFLTAAASRANELSVASQVKFEQGDASATPVETGAFDVVSCIGATWNGSGIQGTVNLMRPALRESGLMLIGEPYWLAEPPPPAFEALKCLPGEFTTLWGTCQRLAASGLELVEMVLADGESWDRYVATQWWTTNHWLRACLPARPAWAQMDPDLLDRIGALLGRRVTACRQALGGYTAAERWICALEDGQSAFAKVAVDTRTAQWLREEHHSLPARRRGLYATVPWRER